MRFSDIRRNRSDATSPNHRRFYFDNAYRGDLIITRGVLYYRPWVNVALEEKQSQSTDQLDRLFPFNVVVGLAREVIDAYAKAHAEPKVNQLGLWQDGQTDEALQARLDAYIAYERNQPAQLTDYEYGLPYPLRFAAGEIKNVSLKVGSNVRYRVRYARSRY